MFGCSGVHLVGRLFSAFLLIPLVYAQWAVEDDGCRTPDRGVGTCILINQCQPIITLIQEAPKPLSPQLAERLRSFQCGFQGREIKVCCPSEGFTSKPPINNNNNNNNNRREPPDVSRHRNINLINNDCGVSGIPDRITNGNVTDLFEFPWMALLSYRTSKGPDFQCGGSIINDRYILTAAHCITALKNPLLGVRVGEHDIRTRVDCATYHNNRVCSPPYQDLAIERVIPHPQYNRTSFANDIGLLRVSSRMNLTLENIKPVCLPTGEWRSSNLTNRNVIVTGWGATETGRSSPVLLKVDIPTTANDECKRKYENIAEITYLHLCAGGKDGKDSCGGDSGGPLHVLAAQDTEAVYVQQGVVSFGPRLCGLQGNPGVYTRVAYYMDWILDNIKS